MNDVSFKPGSSPDAEAAVDALLRDPQTAGEAPERKNRSSAGEGPHDAARPLSRWERFSFAVAHGAAAILLRLLSLKGLYYFGRCFGSLEWFINYKRRARFKRALETLAEGNTVDKKYRRHCREHFMQTRCDKLFYLVADCLSPEVARSLLTITNKPLLDEALSRSRGLYVAVSHHGAQHVILLLMALAGYKVAGVRDPNEGALRRYVRSLIDRRFPLGSRMRILYADAFPREIYRCFEDGYLVGSAMDVRRAREPRRRFQRVRLCGQEQVFLTGPLWIAMRCGAPVVQAFILPEPDFRYRLEIVEVLLDPEKTTNQFAAVQGAIQRYATNLERQLRATPSLISRL